MLRLIVSITAHPSREGVCRFAVRSEPRLLRYLAVTSGGRSGVDRVAGWSCAADAGEADQAILPQRIFDQSAR